MQKIWKHRRKIGYCICLTISAALLVWFAVQTVEFFLNTARQYQSFGEAARRFLLFLITASEPAFLLGISVALSAVGIKLSATAKQKKLARAALITEMVVLAVYALILVSMFVAFPQEWTN